MCRRKINSSCYSLTAWWKGNFKQCVVSSGCVDYSNFSAESLGKKQRKKNKTKASESEALSASYFPERHVSPAHVKFTIMTPNSDWGEVKMEISATHGAN